MTHLSSCFRNSKGFELYATVDITKLHVHSLASTPSPLRHQSSLQIIDASLAANRQLKGETFLWLACFNTLWKSQSKMSNNVEHWVQWRWSTLKLVRSVSKAVLAVCLVVATMLCLPTVNLPCQDWCTFCFVEIQLVAIYQSLSFLRQKQLSSSLKPERWRTDMALAWRRYILLQ